MHASEATLGTQLRATNKAGDLGEWKKLNAGVISPLRAVLVKQASKRIYG